VIIGLALVAVLAGVAVSAYALINPPVPTPVADSLGTARSSPTPAISPPPSPAPIPTPSVAPTAPPPPPPASLAVQITVSQYGSVVALANTGATCSLTATYPDGSPVAGVSNPQAANADSRVQWSYPQLSRPPYAPGSAGTHRVACTWNGLTDSDTKPFYPRQQL
jgi:hypothetical protein